MDISALLAACSMQVDDALLSSIADVHGRASSQLVVDVSPQTLGRVDGSPDLAAAPEGIREAVTRVLSIGGEPVFGVLPVRFEWAAEFGKTPEELLDPCTAIAVASAKIGDFDHSCRSRGGPRSAARRSCSLESYGRSLLLPGLRRAVLADLTLDSRATVEVGVAVIVADDAASSSMSSGLFFALQPLVPQGPVPVASPTLAPQHGQ